MKLIELSVSNYRSIKSVEDFKITSFQSILGENNCGKSNLLSAIETFLSAGSGGTKADDFNDKSQKIIIKAKFKISSPTLKKIWKPYLLNDELILEKHIWIEIDARTQKETVKNEFHGYQAEPTDWFLSESKIKTAKGDRPKWKEIVEESRLPDYFIENGSCNATIFKKALSKYLGENEVAYDAPDLSATQALGLASNVVASLPKFYLLKAITDYSDEIDKRSSNTTFRKLMADLSDRIFKQDPTIKKSKKHFPQLRNYLTKRRLLIRLQKIGWKALESLKLRLKTF